MTGRRNAEAGFTLLEMIVSVAIIGILSAAFVPSIINPSQVRLLDSAAREILTELQLAKWQAGAGKINHRVRFYSQSDRWWHVIEAETAPGTWTGKPGRPARSVPTAFALTLTLPSDSSVVFAPTGFVSGFDSTKNQILLASAKLASLGQPGRRRIFVFASGSLRMAAESGG